MKTLVLDGGGQLGSFVWGVLIELYRLGLRPNYFDQIIATSAGVFNSCYFATEQLEEGTRIWSSHLPRNFWKWNRNDMNYLERVLREIEPLNGLHFTRPQIFAALCNPYTFGSELVMLNQHSNPIQVMLASASMPFLTGPGIIDSLPFYDAGLVAQPPIAHATIDQETWVILSTPKGYRQKLWSWRVLSLCAVHDSRVRKLLWDCPSCRNSALELTESYQHFKVIQPKKELLLGWRSSDEELICHTINLGQNTATRFAIENRW